MRKLIIVLFIVLISVSVVFAEGFEYKNINFIKDGETCWEAVGEVTNNTGTDYSQAFFVITFYDNSGKIILVKKIYIVDFLNGQTKSFSRGDCNTSMYNIYTYKIYFDFGN